MDTAPDIETMNDGRERQQQTKNYPAKQLARSKT